MPILNANLNYLKKSLNLDLEELKSLLFDYGLEVEEVNEKENIIKIDITPNRLELLSSYSLVEHLLYFLDKKENKFPNIKESGLKIYVDERNKRKTVAFVIKNVNLDEDRLKELIEFQEKIHISLFRKRKRAAMGVYDLDKINGNIYFKPMKPEEISFVPLKESKIIKGKELLNIEKGKEYGYLLETYEKEGYWPVFVDEADKILSVPPIINSNDIGNVNVNTKNLFIEISGDDLDYLIKHAPLIIKVMLSITEGELYNVEVIYKDKKINTRDLIIKKKVKDFNFNPKEYFNTIKDLEILKRVGYIKEEDLFIPWYRYDIKTSQDIAEDYLIALGLKINSEIPELFTVGEEIENNKIFNFIRDLMIGLGFLENIGEFLTSNRKLKDFDKENKDIIIENSTDENFDTVRTTLMVSLIEFLSNNVNYSYPQKIFEIGKIYDLDAKKEVYSIGFAWSENKITFNEAKQIIEYLLRRLNISYKLIESTEPYFLKGRQAKIVVNNKIIGEFGEIYPELLLKYNMEIPTIIGEIKLEEILKNNLKNK